MALLNEEVAGAAAGVRRAGCRSQAGTRSVRGTTRRRPSPWPASAATSGPARREAGLRAIPGVGASIAAKIVQYQQTGTIRQLDDLRATIPDGVREMTKIPALGPKRGLHPVQGARHQLPYPSCRRRSTRAGWRDLRGFGPKSEEKLRHGIELNAQSLGQRVPLNVASDVAEGIVAAGSARSRAASAASYAGSLRRFRETIGDIDVLAAASDSAPLMKKITELPGVGIEVIAAGDDQDVGPDQHRPSRSGRQHPG